MNQLFNRTKLLQRLILLLLALFSLAFGLRAQVNLTNGLVAYYPFTGNALDASGNSNNGTLSGSAAIVADQWGNTSSACNMSGPNNAGRVTIPNSSTLQFTTGASFSYWMRLNSNVGTNGFGNIVAGGSHCMFAKDGDAGGGLFALTALSGSNLAISIGNVSQTTLNYTLAGYTTGMWVHLVYVMDATAQYLYVNGSLAATVTGASSFTTMNTKQLCLGRFGSNWYPIDGALDEFRVYNRALNAQEAAALATSNAATVSVTNISPLSVCAGGTIAVDFSSSGVSNGNMYRLELSDAAGSFTNAMQIGSLVSFATTGTISGTIPQGMPSGSGYKVRVTTDVPVSIGAASTQSLTINGVLGDIPAAASFRYMGNFNGNEFYYSLISQTWTAAQTTCQNNGGNLATVPDAATNTFLNTHATAGCFIGYTDQVTEGTFLWADGSPTTYTNWNAGEPNNSGNEDYTTLQVPSATWNDINGTVTAPFILQLRPASSNSPQCEGSSLTLFGATLAGATYQWSGPNGFSSTQQNPVIANATLAASGTYTLTITKGGCSATVTTDVTINQSPDGMGMNSALLSSLSSGLVLYYPMNGNANDASGNGLNGTMVGGVTATMDRFGNAGGALLFNGSNGYIDVPDGVYFNGSSFTVSCWVKTNNYATWSRVFDFGNGPGNNNVLMAVTNGTSGRPAAEVYNGTTSGGQISSPSTTIPTGQWSLLVFTWSAGTGRLYMNGTQLVSGTITAPQNVVRTICYIGRSNWSGDAYANGAFDDFRIYNRTLSSAEMNSLLLEQPDAMNLVAMPAAICPNTASAIKVIGTQKGVSYQLQNAATSTNIGSAQAGNCDTLSFATGNLTANTTFQVVATGPSGCSVIISAVTVSVITAANAPVTTGASRCGPGSVTLSASGAPVGAVYYWYTAATGGTQIFIGPAYTTPSLNATTNYYVSIYANGCESNRTPVIATINLATSPTVNLYSGLIMHYKMNGNVADSSGRSNNATLVSTGTYVNDRLNQPNSALSIASNNYIDCGTPSDMQALTNQVTVSMWVNANYFAGGNMPLLNDWANTGVYSGFYGYWDAQNVQQNRVRWRVDGNAYLESNVNVPFGQWTLITCTYDGSWLRTYQDGQLTGAYNYVGSIGWTGTPTQIGRQANGSGSQIYSGKLDDIRVYNRALNADEIMALYFNDNVAFSNTPLCAGSTLVLSAPTIPGATYSWSGPNGFSSSQEDPAPVTNVSAADAGTYTLVITNTNNGCVSSPQVNTVVVNALPTAPTTVNDTVCASGNAVLTASGGSGYNWYAYPVAGSVVNTGATYTINNLSVTDTFYVSTVSAAGCESPTRTPVIAVYQNPIQSNLVVTGSTICAGNNATVMIQNSQPGVSYVAYYNAAAVSSAANGNGGTIGLTINTASLANGSNTISIVATQASCGSVTLSSTATVIINPLPSATVTASGPTTFCTGGSVTLSAPAGLTYNWNTGAVSQSINVNSSGSYSVIVTDANGCSNSSSVTNVSVVTPPTAGITAAGPTTFCQGDNVTLSASGGGTYTWSNGSTAASINATVSGNYFVIASNGTCADTSAVIAVTVNPSPTVTVTASGATTFCTGGDVTLTSSAASGNTWSNSATTNAIVVTQSGNYSVMVTDGNGCSGTSAAVNVNVLAQPVATISASGPLTFCQGDNVVLTANGGTGYSWSNGSTSTAILVSNAGTYYVVASNGYCADTSSTVTVNVNPLPTVNFSMGVDTFFCINSPVYTLQAGSPAGGTYSGPGVSGNQFNPATSGTGYVTIDYSYTDANGCSATASSTVYVDVCTGVPVLQDATLSAVPNPTSGSTMISWPSNSGITQLEVFDATGRVIFSKQVEGLQQQEISLNAFATGVYQVKLTGKEVLFLRIVRE